MCGILGLIDFSQQISQDTQDQLAAALDRLSHRGPDDWGIVAINEHQLSISSMKNPEAQTQKRINQSQDLANVCLAHRRLSIIDLSDKGHQPMKSSDGRYWITYNGEIYNYQELRKELENEGISFVSSSDTEVLLALFQKEGRNCLSKLRGMFAFAIWDEQNQELFLARDRFGLKPLYYRITANQQLMFASELKAFCGSGNLRQASEVEFLRRGSIQTPETVMENIQSLQPGTCASWQGQELTIEPYWQLSESILSERREVEVDQAASKIKEALIDSVKAHMVSDVPVGVFLSGGLDSAALVAAIRQFHQGPLKTFTLVFPGTHLDEGDGARVISKAFQTEHTELEVTKQDFLEGLPEFFETMDQPTVDGLNTFFVARMAKKAGIKVVLSGVGGDEILGGYPSFNRVPKLRRFLKFFRKIPGLLPLSALFVEWISANWSSKLAQILRSDPKQEEELWKNVRVLMTEHQIHDLGLQCQRSEVISEPSTQAAHDFSKVSYYEMKHFMIPQLLRDSDNFTMCHSLELRTPFVDHLFVQAVCAAGIWQAEGDLTPKATLFYAMKDFLPKSCLELPKRGFTLPFQTWLEEILQQASGQEGTEQGMVELLGQRCYQPFIQQFLAGKLHWSRIWAFYVLERYKQKVVKIDERR